MSIFFRTGTGDGHLSQEGRCSIKQVSKLALIITTHTFWFHFFSFLIKLRQTY